jgi:hypothetical protein
MVTGKLPDGSMMADCGEAKSQFALEIACHCNGLRPGLLTVIVCAEGDEPPSIAVKESNARFVCNTALLPAASAVTTAVTGIVLLPAVEKIFICA